MPFDLSNQQIPNMTLTGLTDQQMPQQDPSMGNEMMGVAEPMPPQKDHFRNLVPELDPVEVRELEKKLWPKIKKAREGSSEKASNFASVIKLMSVKIPTPGGTGGSTTQTFGTGGEDGFIKNSGSRDLFSTALIETAMNICFSALTILFLKDKKFDAYVGSHLAGQQGVKEVCDRVIAWCDAYFSKEMLPGYRQKLATSLLYAITDGEGVRKVYHTPNRGYPDAALLKPGDFFYTEEDTSFFSVRGFVHMYQITRGEMLRKIESGEWTKLFTAPMNELGNDAGKRVLHDETAKQTGRMVAETDEYDEDFSEIYNGYEYYNDLHIESDPDRQPNDPYDLPYTVQLGDEGIITHIRHNYDVDSPLRLALSDYVKYSLLPSYDEYHYGLVNVCGQKAKASTVIQRSLVDSSLLANASTGFIAPTGRVTDRTFDLKPGQFNSLPHSEADMTKAISYMPFHDPNPVVLQLMQQLENEIKQFGHVVNQDMVTLASRAPATSLLAVLNRMEQLPNAILQGIYDSFSQELRIFKRKFFEWLPPQEMLTIHWQGEILQICKEDFSPGLEIVPCGQHSVESTAYKMMRSQLLLDQAKEMPQFHNIPFVLTKLYQDMGLKEQEISQIIINPNAPQPPPPSMDPLTENAHILTSKPVKAYIEQNHEAHITVHSLLLNHPDPQVISAAQAHMKEHEAMQMMVQLQQMAGVQIPQQPSQLPPDQENQLAVALAQAAQEMQHQQQQQKPIDPGLIKLEEIKMKRETAGIEAEIAMKKLEVESNKNHIQSEIEALKLAIHAQQEVRENLQLELQAHSGQLDDEIKKHNQQLDHLTGQLESLQKVLEISEKEMQLSLSSNQSGDTLEQEQAGE